MGWSVIMTVRVLLIGHIYYSTMRTKIGVLFLLLQLGCVVYAHFGPSRYFAWAPNDYIVEFNLQVVVNGRVLSSDESSARYRLPGNGVYEFPAQHIIDAIQQYEQTYGREDHAQVLLTYRLNGGDKRQWRWPGDAPASTRARRGGIFG